MDLIILIICLFGLWKGGDLLISGAVKVAENRGGFFAGFIIVALGTSFPEFLVSLIATLRDSSGLAVGNIIGSNISNIGLILGVTALLSPSLITRPDWQEQKTPLIGMAFLTVATLLFMWQGFTLGRIEGGSLLLITAFLLYTPARRPNPETPETRNTGGGMATPILKAFIGGGTLGISAFYLVESAVNIAVTLGVSEFLIGASVVAIGTSIPELVASLIAVRRDLVGIIVGNILGSNFFNLACLSMVAVIRPISITPDLFTPTGEAVFLITFTLAIFAIIATRRINRLAGAGLLIGYAFFIFSMV